MRQTEAQRRGEIAFRSFHQQFVDRFAPLFTSLINMRVPMLDQMVFEDELRSPFIEIGAELGLNGAVLASRHGLAGICLDISPDALLTGREYRRRMGLDKEAALVCADGHNLPLRNNSFLSVLGWGTFHHFPDPAPVLREARRVLHPEGLFAFEEEPIRRRLGLNLYYTGTPPDGLSRFERLLLRLGLLPFIAKLGGKQEVEQGIHEGSFSVRELERLLGVFNEFRLGFMPQLTGGVASEGRLLRRILPGIMGATRAFNWATNWFGGAASCRARKHTIGCRVIGGEPRIVLIKRREPLDRIALVTVGDAEASLFGAGLGRKNIRGDGTVAHEMVMPEDQRSREIVAVILAGEADLVRVDLESTSEPAAFYSWRPHKPVDGRRPLEDLLGCPSCIDVTDQCLAPRCQWPCVKACPNGVLRQREARPEYDKAKCSLCLACLHACPFDALDRAHLEVEGNVAQGEGRLYCRLCGDSFIIRDGIAVLMEPRERELLPDRWS